MTNPFAHLDALAAADLVHRGEASPAELCDAALAAIDAVNPTLNAVIHRCDERARADASAVDPSAPLAGVPIVVKDLDGALAGEPLHLGTRHLRDANYIAPTSSWLFERLQAAGCVIVGKTNTPEFGLLPTTESSAWGAARNPWNTDHSTGGSSGGSAAAVAAGIVPLGHAGDGGGSIRIPASECGLVGLKPTRGRVSLGPIETESWGGLVARGVVSRSVRDTAAVLDVIGHPGVGDPYAAPAGGPYLPLVGTDPGPLRIGTLTDTGDGTEVHPDCLAAADAAVRLLERLGHHVDGSAPSAVSDEAFVNELTGHFLTAYTVWVAQDVADIGRRTGTEVTPDGVEPWTWALAEAGRQVDAVSFADALDGLRGSIRPIVAWWADGHDLLITPTLPELPPRIGEFDATDDNPLAPVFRSTATVLYAVPFNVTGQPAISVPLAMSADGLPVGVQIVAAPGREDLLIQVAAQLEIAAPWAERRPGIWAG